MTNILPYPGKSPYPREIHVWEPQGPAKAVVLLAHGMAEHIARYEPLGASLASRGYLVAGADHLGHGPKAPLPGWFAEQDGWGCLLEDLSLQMKWLSGKAPGVPRVLLGHSMGSFLAREYAIRCPDGLDALVLSGTGWQPKALCLAGLVPAGVLCLLGQGQKPTKLLDALAFSANNKPFREVGGSKYAWLSRDVQQVQLYEDDPLCGFVFTAGGFKDFFGGLLALSDTSRLEAVSKGLPVLLISGDKDPVGGMGKGVEAIARQYRDAGLVSVTARLYEGARHELFNELNREEVFKDLADWLDASLRG